MNIVAVVVTYNRIELLKRTVRCLQQNKPVSSIVVVNNGSTDATAEWLKTQPGLIVISQANVGGSGGFYTGMQYAYQAGALELFGADCAVAVTGIAPCRSGRHRDTCSTTLAGREAFHA